MGAQFQAFLAWAWCSEPLDAGLKQAAGAMDFRGCLLSPTLRILGFQTPKHRNPIDPHDLRSGSLDRRLDCRADAAAAGLCQFVGSASA